MYCDKGCIAIAADAVIFWEVGWGQGRDLSRCGEGEVLDLHERRPGNE